MSRGLPTDVIDFAMGLAGQSPNKEALALIMIKLLKDKLDIRKYWIKVYETKH